MAFPSPILIRRAYFRQREVPQQKMLWLFIQTSFSHLSKIETHKFASVCVKCVCVYTLQLINFKCMCICEHVCICPLGISVGLISWYLLYASQQFEYVEITATYNLLSSLLPFLLKSFLMEWWHQA